MTESEQSKLVPKTETRKDVGDGMPLVFISHDSRDAELAEAFSKLLKSVSAGMLKSFRSSDRLGSEGIQYGDEWYKRLMERLADASEVVCLFTKRSLNRPWILFEAGVAKGKLDTPVHGIALGVSLSEVSTGPFYQFQNCQDDEDGLTGLVMQLLKRIPNAEPDREAIGLQVHTFKSNVEAILNRIDGTGNIEDSEGTEKDENSAAKLFEEIKVMVRDLPSNLEERIADGSSIFRGKKLRRLHPMMIDELMHMPPRSPDPYLGILIMASMFRDDIPWLYELGMDAYRTSRNSKRSAKESLMRFHQVLEYTIHGPLFDEEMMKSKDGRMMLRDFEHMTRKLIDRCLINAEEIKSDGM
ncbi:MAG: toll/interleukin-1 receptor domain-containing protein [Candidatus Sumerlaeia bacterium]